MDIPLINPSFTIEFLKLREKKNIDIAVEFLRCADIFIDDIKLEEIESDVTQMN
nr:hypothetical protein [bacterium]